MSMASLDTPDDGVYSRCDSGYTARNWRVHVQQIDQVSTMAQQAAMLLPEPPAAHDIDGYLAWKELVWSTAMRLSAIAGSSLGEASADLLDHDPDAPVTARHLMDLARVARLEWQLAHRPSAEGLGRAADAARVIPEPVVTQPEARGVESSCPAARLGRGPHDRHAVHRAGSAHTRTH